MTANHIFTFISTIYICCEQLTNANQVQMISHITSSMLGFGLFVLERTVTLFRKKSDNESRNIKLIPFNKGQIEFFIGQLAMNFNGPPYFNYLNCIYTA